MLSCTKFRKYIEFFVIYIYIRGFYLHEYILRDVFEMFKKIFKKLKNIRNKDSQAEITEEEAGLFDFIYFNADGQTRNFEEVLVCIGLIVNKKGIPIDTRDKTRLHAAREIFNKKTFVKKDKLFVSASKKISGFLSKAQWENAVESYKDMLNYSVLLKLHVSLLKPEIDFKYNGKLSYTKDDLVSYSVQARLCSTSVLNDGDKQRIADEYKRMTEYEDGNHSRSEYWMNRKQLRRAHEAYEDVEETLIKEMHLFTQEPSVDRLKKLLQTCIKYITCYYDQYGWQRYATTKHLVDDITTIYYQGKLGKAMNLEEMDFKDNVKTCLQAIFGAVPLNYKEFLKLIKQYLVGFDYMIRTKRVSELSQLIKQCPTNIDFSQQPTFEDVTPGTKIFTKIE